MSGTPGLSSSLAIGSESTVGAPSAGVIHVQISEWTASRDSFSIANSSTYRRSSETVSMLKFGSWPMTVRKTFTSSTVACSSATICPASNTLLTASAVDSSGSKPSRSDTRSGESVASPS